MGGGGGGGAGAGFPDPPWKSQVAICFLRNYGMDLTREAIGPLGPNCFPREIHTALCEIR